MKANVFYKAIKDKGLTLDQVEQLECQGAVEFIGEPIDSCFFENLKGTLIEELKQLQCRTILQELENQLVGGNRIWLKTNFPEAVFEINSKNRVVYIYLDGKPADEEGEE